MESVEPQHIKQFMRWRVAESKKAYLQRGAERQARQREKKVKVTPVAPLPAAYGQVRANRARVVISDMWNWAREEGLTARANPCTGVSGFDSPGRDASPDDPMVARLLEHADKPLEFAIRLADIVGQRPGDVRRIQATDIRDGLLHVRQGKTQMKLRIEVGGLLAVLLEEIREFKRALTVHSMALLVKEDGQPLTRDALRYRFDKAHAAAGIPKNDFQFRDFRAKVATSTDDTAGTKAAQAILGHTSEEMTNHYIRHKVGRKVKPIR
jgi:integrase